MKVSDLVFDILADHQITDVFTVSGGGIAHLLDSLGRNPRFRYFCNYHEQACAVAAEGYARMTGRPALCLVTTGPGALNALSGIVGAWHDSLPMVVISGQVRADLIADYEKLRQKGPQEGNTIVMAGLVTKYAVSVTDPKRIRFELEKALHLATTGRPGPVWIELPFNVQGAQVTEEELGKFVADALIDDSSDNLASDADKFVAALLAAERPLVVAGNGIQLAECRPQFRRFIEQFQIPVVVPYTAKDLIPEAHPLNAGVFGTNGQRRANFAVQNADLLICLGAGLSVGKIGFNFQGFAPKARKIIVDVDALQVEHQPLRADLPIVADLGDFLDALAVESAGVEYQPSDRWRAACARWKQRYPVILPEYLRDQEHVDMYVFMDRLANVLGSSDVLVTGNGFDVVSCYQAFKVKDGQRVLFSGNWGSMGWDLPMAIGACCGQERRPTVLVTGDGSIQCNLQELLTVKYYRLPLKLFVYSNEGYGSIRVTQKSLFEGRLVGADPSSGVGCLDWSKVAALYDFKYQRIENNDGVEAGVRAALATDGPVLCEVNLSCAQVITPKASAFRRPDGTFESRPLEDMAPFLPREEVHENMHLFDEPLVETAQREGFDRMNEAVLKIGGRDIGAGSPCFIIAEAGVNHNGSLELAHQLVETAAAAGADAVKFQTFKTERLVTRQAPKAEYQIGTTGAGESQFDMLRRLELSAEAHVELIAHCKRLGVQFLSTPFEEESADLLLRLGLRSLKLPSGEITNLPFLDHVARLQVPVILSTGMASLGEVEEAVAVFRAAGNHQLALLHCVSNYPANPADCNLRAMRTLAQAFGVPVGFSDHTPGIEVALGAAALGAAIIEKHFTLDRSLPGPDHQASLDPAELKALVAGVRKVESALGNGCKLRRPSEENTASVARKSLIARHDIRDGQLLTREDISVMRPGTGLAPALLPALLGRTAKTGIPRGTPITLAMLA